MRAGPSARPSARRRLPARRRILSAMPAVILVSLKLIFVAFIYLFVWQIGKAIAAHIGTGQPVGGRRRGGAGLAVVRSDTQKGMSVDVRQPIVLGRSGQADVLVEDAYASDFHVRLVNEAGSLSLFDLGSTNGTYVNGKRVTAPLKLNKGDAVQIGRTVLEVT